MQSCTMPVSAFDLLEGSARAERLGKIHHEHIGNGQVRVKQVFTGPSVKAIHAAMDEREALLEAAGGQNFHRTRIGRNSSCPCGSGRKFKKCCIDTAIPT